MASLHNSCSLELSVSVPGFTSSAKLHTTGDAYVKRDFDINEIPLTMEEEESWWAKANDKYEEQDNGGNGYGSSNKKLRLTNEQSHLNKKMHALAQLGLKPRQVEVWFQNRRA
ncbi:hypothetical protein FRX31_009795, partial [Thalictrum thalictroides]